MHEQQRFPQDSLGHVHGFELMQLDVFDFRDTFEVILIICKFRRSFAWAVCSTE